MKFGFNLLIVMETLEHPNHSALGMELSLLLLEAGLCAGLAAGSFQFTLEVGLGQGSSLFPALLRKSSFDTSVAWQ